MLGLKRVIRVSTAEAAEGSSQAHVVLGYDGRSACKGLKQQMTTKIEI